MKQTKNNPELATFTLLNPDFSAGHKQTEGAKGVKEQQTKT